MTTTCANAAPAPFACPTLEQSIDATAQLLPRGRVWPANDRAMLPRFLAWLAGLVGVPAPGDYPPGFVQMGIVAAIGAVRNFLETQLCALRLEFWCQTETLTNDQWLIDYGLPDDCEPFPDLCAKVAALGGRRCELYQKLAAAVGWTVSCVSEGSCPGINAFAGNGFAGNVILGGPPSASHIELLVYTGDSPAYQGGSQTPFMPGRIFAGMLISCPPDINPLECLMDRIAPAHVVVAYQIFD